ncbi:MAG: HlyD family efflux transporter periplasmic adaptor subunit [Pirellulaceae bacterium]|nr:HlyD family efflux transporter periplasmic adaptor subunit [Pirellulaceae bacterium]
MNRPAEQKSDRIECPKGDGIRLSGWLLAGLVSAGTVVSVGTITGCNTSTRAPTAAKTKTPAARAAKIVAQGQILPAGGLIRLAATPGDIVDSVEVSIGDPVTAGQPLITMRSLKIHEARSQALQSRLQDAKQQKQNAIEQARLQLSATEVKLDRIASQAQALVRQEEILKLAEKQVTASENIFEKLSSIAKDPLTSDFVGALQLQQQQLAVSEAQLKYRQQAESFQQAKETAEFEKVAAEEERRAASMALQVAQSSLAVAAIESELNALEIQQQATVIVAPQAAVVVAINTRVGEAAAQFPLIELADDTKTICEAEVVETDAALIAPGQTVRITSPALSRELRGKVLRRGQLVGRPQLAIADPLAKADYRSVMVTIEIDPNDVPIASKWLQLQVNVEIELEAAKATIAEAPQATVSAP